jgi:rod shape-determining protein MreD
MSRNVQALIVIAAAMILQVTVANRLPLPGSVTPDLVLLAVVALALVNGSLLGLVTGFSAGLAADIMPPADHTLGRYALVYCLIGYVCGAAAAEMERSPVLPFVAVAAGALAGSVLYSAVGAMLGDPRASWLVVSHILPLQVLYDVIVSPFVVWAVLRFSRRAERQRGMAGLDAVPGFYRAR